MTNPASAEDYDRWLDACREQFGDPPRRFGLLTRWFAHWVPPPAGLKFSDGLSLFFHLRPELLRTGVLVWGHLLTAPRGDADGPATAVFCPLPGGGPTVPELRKLAAELVARRFGEEHDRPFGLPVPTALTGRHACEVSSLFVARKHLPERRLASLHVPLVVSPGEPRLAMILPVRYWPADLVEHWSEPP